MPHWTDIADASELRSGARRCVSVECQGRALTVLVINVDDQLFALENVCPHAGLPLDQGELTGRVLTCPYHGYAYNLSSGANVDMPEIEPPVRTFPVRRYEGRVQVDLEADGIDDPGDGGGTAPS